MKCAIDREYQVAGKRGSHAARLLGKVALAGLLAALPLSVVLADARLLDIAIERMDERTRVVVGKTEAVPGAATFELDGPRRVVLDFAQTSSDITPAVRTLQDGPIRRVSVVEDGSRSRLVVELESAAAYQVHEQGAQLVFYADGRSGVPASARNADQTYFDVDFRRTEHGGGRIELSLRDASRAEVRREGGNIVIDLPGVELPESMVRRLNVLDFATPVQHIDSFNRRGSARVTIRTVEGDDFEFFETRGTGTLSVEVRSLALSEEELVGASDTALALGWLPEEAYAGERISLNFQDVDIRRAIYLLVETSGKNLVISDSVSGTLTMNLNNIPWDQALDVILKTRNLERRDTGNIIYIAPAADIRQQEQERLQAQRALENLVPLHLEIIDLNHARAREMAELLVQRGGTDRDQTRLHSFLSSRGNISVDERTNRLLVVDTAESLRRLRPVIEELDQPARQVLIESRVVMATEQFSRSLGVRFGVSRLSSVDGNRIGLSGSLRGAEGLVSGNVPPLADRLNVSLPPMESAGRMGLAIANLPRGIMLDLELDAAEAENRSETISRPRILTQSNQSAEIRQGFEVPYQTRDGDGGLGTDFKAADLSLSVTPRITPDNDVIMEIVVTKDEPDFAQRSPVTGEPPIRTQQIQTVVQVANGETLVLGGVFEQNRENATTRVPFFGDLPVVGSMFRSTLRRNEKKELLIFVTPRIQDESMRVD